MTSTVFETVYDDFCDYVIDVRNCSNSEADKYKTIAKDFVSYLKGEYRKGWRRKLKNGNAQINYISYIEAQNLTAETIEEYKQAVKLFQSYIRSVRGRLKLFLIRLLELKQRPLIALAWFGITFLSLMIGYYTFVDQYGPRLFNSVLAFFHLGQPTNFAPSSGSLLYEENFDSGVAHGWGWFGNDNWSIVDDGTGNKVFRADGSKLVNANVEATLGLSRSWANFAFQVQVMLPPEGQYAGGTIDMMVRRQNCLSYDFSIYNGNEEFVKEDNMCHWPVTYGQVNQPLKRGVWYTFRIDVQGSTLTAYLDGQEVATANDGEYKDGLIALAAWRAGPVYFDNIKVWSLP